MKHFFPLTLLLAGGLSLPLGAQAQTPVFINEIHYDNSGTDTGEVLEVAGPAGTDLSNWSIVLYNGTSSQRAPYTTTPLEGTIPNQQNGYGTVSVTYPANGIQNGAPDGLALVNNGSVVQFLSYEGSFTAASGPAAGMTSQDIGVSESSDTPAGVSLQLTGTGTTYEDFAWTSLTDDSFGQVNAGQTFGTAPATPPIVINEIDYDQPGTDDAEFIELKNTGTTVANLDAYELVLVNGSNNTIYQTIDLPPFELAPGAYYVISGNAATVPNTDLDVSPNTNLIQNGAPDAVALRITTTEEIVDAVSYEGEVPDYREGNGTVADTNDDAGLGLSRTPDGTDTDNNQADFTLAAITPGAANGGDDSPDQPGTVTLIHDIQGDGFVSPLEGQLVTIEGIVVGDFQAGDGDAFNSDLGGFYVQEENRDWDADPTTSEGIFVFAPEATNLNPGDVVTVTGEVEEFNGLTELTEVSTITVTGTAPVPTPTEVQLPATDQELESVEGMLVRFPQPLVIAEYFNFDRFGEIVLAQPLEDQERPYQPTSYVEPGPAAAQIEQANELRRITLDDARTTQNPDPARHPNGEVFDLSNRFRGGDQVQNTVGVLSYGFGKYRVQPTQGADYIQRNPRPEQPDAVGGSLKVATFNVLNYFLSLDDGTDDCGPDRNQECRGADSPQELERQRAKIIAALAEINADIFGLVELENTPDVQPLEDLVEGLNATLGEGTYDYIETGTLGSDAIKVGIIYQPGTVTPVGDYAALTDASFTDPNNSGQQKNRPALAQTFREESTGGTFTVAVNHFKSKGSPCGAGDDDPQQGSCNDTRAEAADALVKWLATDPTGSGDPDYMITGDLNAYDEEDPIDQIKAGADDAVGTQDDYVDLVEAFNGEFSYSYVFNGQFGYLDYALANRSLFEQVTGATEWHINADEPDILDYDLSFKKDEQDALYQPNAYRASDHDPVIAGLDLLPSVCAAEPTLPFLKANGKPARPKVLLDRGQRGREGVVQNVKLRDFGTQNKLIVVSQRPITVSPQDGTSYEASPEFGQGDEIAEGVFAVRNNDFRKDDFIITDLKAKTTYYLQVFLYTSGEDCEPNYRSEAVAETRFTTKKGKGKKDKEDRVKDLISQLKDHVLNVYPNPVRDVLHINVPSEIDQQIDITLLDLWGNRVSLGTFRVQTGNNQLSIDLSDTSLRKQLYLLRISGQHQTYPMLRLYTE